jgi:CHAT domain-containing protein
VLPSIPYELPRFPLADVLAGREDIQADLRRSRFLATLSLGLGWLALTTSGPYESRPDPELAALAAALGERRPVEPRLTGGFAYAPCRSLQEPGRLLPRISCSPPPAPGSSELRAVSDALEEIEEISRGPKGHARGVANLVGRVRVAAAVEALERAAAQAPRDARVLSDLSAAYFVRAHQDDDPWDLVRALDAAARACEADPFLTEARFNLALSLETLHLRRLAREEWSAYLGIDQSPGWADEAKAHLRELGRTSGSERWKRELPRLEAAAIRRNEAEVRDIVEASPQLAREHVLETVLGAWGDAVSAGNQQAADHALRIAAGIGKALREVNGDSTVERAVQSIERAGSPERLRDLARGHQELRAGLAAYRLFKPNEFGHFAAAYELLRRGGSPLQLWALCGWARIRGYAGKYDEALRAYETILAATQGKGFSSLEGWTHWGMAWAFSRKGQPMEALRQARAMESDYEKAREAENLGAAQLLVGDALFLLGQNQPGWRYLFRALDSLADSPDAFRRHVALQSAATYGLEGGVPWAGLLFEDESLRVADEIQEPLRRTEALWGRAKILASLGRTPESLADLKAARRTVGAVAQSDNNRKLQADLLWIEGEVLRSVDPRRAVESFTQAISAYQGLSAFAAVAYASFGRARAERVLGLDGAADADLGAAVRILEDPALKIKEDDLRLSYTASIQDIYDELILTRWNRRSPEGALEALERSRTFPVPADADLAGAPARLPNGTVVEYALLPDRLLIWVIDSNGISSLEKQIASTEVDALVDRFVATAKKGTDDAEIRELGARLQDLLIPTMVASLPADRVIYFVPDRALNKVPFVALWSREAERFFIEDHPVAIAPSLSQLLADEAPSPGPIARPSALLVGNPAFDQEVFQGLRDLPGAQSEIAAAQNAFRDSMVLTGRDATRNRILAELDGFDILVFAGHAIINSTHPSQSLLVLAPEAGDGNSGRVLAQEIGGRSLSRLRLVVLSACSSIGPRAARGAGLAGFARPFLAAGAQTVVGSLWDVTDRRTAGLLADFYRGVASGRDPVDALRKAQLARMRQGGEAGRDLGVWAAFEVVR